MATASMGAGSGFPTDMLQLVDIEAAEVQRGVVACALYRHGRRKRPTAAFEASLLAWAYSDQVRFSSVYAKLQWLYRYPRSEPYSTT